MFPPGIDSERLAALERAYEELRALYEEHGIQITQIDERQRGYHASYGRSILAVELAGHELRKDVTRAMGEIRAALVGLSADDIHQRTNDASLSERVSGLNRQMIYQSIVGGVLLVLILVLLVLRT